MNFEKVILVTGGCGFIGSHLVRHLVNKYPNYRIINFDALTYAGNMENLTDIDSKPNYTFFKGDIRDMAMVNMAFDSFDVTDIIHLAAESHVDRSIKNPSVFAETNVIGTLNLLNAARERWCVFPFNCDKHRFHHVSTDEVYGSLDMNPDNKFREDTPYDPHSPYSASKAASDHFVKAYHDTYGLDVTISNCSNNYGPNQFPEKLIPLVINRLETNDKIPVYGKGLNVRDWLYVEDHARAIDLIFHEGKSGETYNIGGNHEMTNIDIVTTIINIYNELTDNDINKDDVINFIKDPRGDAHDLRYAIDSTKLQTELGWSPEETFETGIKKTIQWYLDNKKWVENVTSGEYQKWIDTYYNRR
jgi:dTDP-glucose 4,6-dehydratase